jgi:hypothetical protein
MPIAGGIVIRKVFALILGYLIFAVSAFVYFRFTGQAPEAAPTAVFAVISLLYGLVFSFLGGFVSQVIAKASNLKLNFALAACIAGFAFFSLLMTHGSHWTQIISIVLFAPMSIAGGYLRSVIVHVVSAKDEPH